MSRGVLLFVLWIAVLELFDAGLDLRFTQNPGDAHRGCVEILSEAALVGARQHEMSADRKIQFRFNPQERRLQ